MYIFQNAGISEAHQKKSVFLRVYVVYIAGLRQAFIRKEGNYQLYNRRCKQWKKVSN